MGLQQRTGLLFFTFFIFDAGGIQITIFKRRSISLMHYLVENVAVICGIAKVEN
jgi:hypothetical protein